MKVSNMIGRSGRPVANQFIIEEKGGFMGNFERRETFQSYDSVIAVCTVWGDSAVRGGKIDIVLDANKWDYSRTTLKYLCMFLRIPGGKKEIETNIKNGAYRLEDLNK